jgi:hypothetical protein
VKKKRTDLLNEMMAARQRFDNAAKELVAATQRALPVGTDVVVSLGRARVRGRVTQSGGSWWSTPDAVWIENITTGKRRKFCATFISHDLLVVDSAVEP